MLTDSERAALVEELARGASGLVQGSPYDLATISQQRARQQEVEHYLMPIIDRLLTTRREPAADAVGDLAANIAAAWGQADAFGGHDPVFDHDIHISVRKRALKAAEVALAAVEPEPGLLGTELTGAYEAMMELSMYVGEEEWDSAQRHIRPASRQVSIADAQAYTVAAYENERQAMGAEG